MGLRLGNLLERALRVIPRVAFEYRKFKGRTTNESGNVVQEYNEWIATSGMVQPGVISSFGGKNVSEDDYKDMGFDWSKRHLTVWCKADLDNIRDNVAPDQVRYLGRVYNVIRCSDWDDYDGWKRCYCVEDLSVEGIA